MELVARIDFRRDDEELERAIKEYKHARGVLIRRLMEEGFDLNIGTKPKETQETVSGN